MESDLVEVLSSFFGERVFPLVAPNGVARPYCTFQQVGGNPVQYLRGGTNTGTARIQINVWASTCAEATSLIRSIETAVTSAPLFAGTEGGAVDLYEEPQALFGKRQDFSFKY